MSSAAIGAIESCRTTACGGHVEQCRCLGPSAHRLQQSAEIRTSAMVGSVSSSDRGSGHSTKHPVVWLVTDTLLTEAGWHANDRSGRRPAGHAKPMTGSSKSVSRHSAPQPPPSIVGVGLNQGTRCQPQHNPRSSSFLAAIKYFEFELPALEGHQHPAKIIPRDFPAIDHE